jgi:D-alanyl-D-alanine carboxypeptidase
MRPTPVVPDARPVPSIAEQLRAARHRRERRRRVTAGVLVAAAAALLGARLVAGASAEPAGTSSAGWTTTPTAPTPPTVPTTSPPTGLDPGLVDAFGRAQAEAADAGHELTMTSGFRTADDQAAMLEAEVARRGSLAEALWWVFPPDRSMHVQGLAIDVGDGPAADWLVDEGARFGLCRTLDWEWWHFEWRERWEADRACPAPARTPDDAPLR